MYCEKVGGKRDQQQKENEMGHASQRSTLRVGQKTQPKKQLAYEYRLPWNSFIGSHDPKSLTVA